MINYSGRSAAITASARAGFAVAPHDEDDLPFETRGLYVGSSGDIVLHLASGDEITLANVPGGTVLPLRVRRVVATGTTATQLVGLY